MNNTVESFLKNNFVEVLRISNKYDEDEYLRLVEDLKELALLLKGENKIDKKVAERLFSLNDFLIGYISICKKTDDKFGLQDKVIDAWSELNDLIVDCLCD